MSTAGLSAELILLQLRGEEEFRKAEEQDGGTGGEGGTHSHRGLTGTAAVHGGHGQCTCTDGETSDVVVRRFSWLFTLLICLSEQQRFKIIPLHLWRVCADTHGFRAETQAKRHRPIRVGEGGGGGWTSFINNQRRR